jgi:Mannosyl-glycoprotein endo-beta-N-acetylglucosaminidase
MATSNLSELTKIMKDGNEPITVNVIAEPEKEVISTITKGDSEMVKVLNNILQALNQQLSFDRETENRRRLEEHLKPKDYQENLVPETATKEGGEGTGGDSGLGLLGGIGLLLKTFWDGLKSGIGLLKQFGATLIEITGLKRLFGALSETLGGLIPKLGEFFLKMSPLLMRFGSLAGIVLSIGEAFEGLAKIIENTDVYKKYSEAVGPKLVEGAEAVGNTIDGLIKSDEPETRTGRTVGDPSKPGSGGAIRTWDDVKNDKGKMSEVWKMARETQKNTGVPAELTVAQFGLESSYGKRMPAGSNNPFGIKARKGEEYTEAMTSEFEGGRMVRKPQRFRKFESLQEAFDAHAKLISKNKRYSEVMKANTPEEIAEAIGKSGYATDPKYKEKILSTMKSKTFNTGREVDLSPDNIKKSDSTPKKGEFTSVIDQEQKGAKYRRDPITTSLDAKLSESIQAVYGEGYRGKVYSGGQHGERRTGSHRHDEGGAADLRVVDPKGKVMKGDDLAKLAQYWRARDFGGVGLEMGQGGIHLDERKEEFLKKYGGKNDWSYGTRTKEQLAAIKRGERGEFPELANPDIVGMAGGYEQKKKQTYAKIDEKQLPEGGKYKEEESEMEEVDEPVLKEKIKEPEKDSKLVTKDLDIDKQVDSGYKNYFEDLVSHLEKMVSFTEEIKDTNKKMADKETEKQSDTAKKEEPQEEKPTAKQDEEAQKVMDDLFGPEESLTASKQESEKERTLSTEKQNQQSKGIFGGFFDGIFGGNKGIMGGPPNPYGQQPAGGFGGTFGQGQNPFGTIQQVLGTVGSTVSMGQQMGNMGKYGMGGGTMGGIGAAQGAIGGIQGVLGQMGQNSPMLGGMGQVLSSVGGIAGSIERTKNMGSMGGGGILGGINAASGAVGAAGNIFNAIGGIGGAMKGVGTSIGKGLSNMFGSDEPEGEKIEWHPISEKASKAESPATSVSSMGPGDDIAAVKDRQTSSSEGRTDSGTSEYHSKEGAYYKLHGTQIGGAKDIFSDQSASLMPSLKNDGMSLESTTQSVQTGKEEMMAPSEPTIINAGGGGGGSGGGGGGGGGGNSQSNPSSAGVMGVDIGVRNEEATLLRAQFGSVRVV